MTDIPCLWGVDRAYRPPRMMSLTLRDYTASGKSTDVEPVRAGRVARKWRCAMCGTVSAKQGFSLTPSPRSSTYIEVLSLLSSFPASSSRTMSSEIISLNATEHVLKAVTIFQSSTAQLTRTFTVDLKVGPSPPRSTLATDVV